MCIRDRLCTAHPKLSPGQIVSVFKRITAKAIFRGKPAMKKALSGGEFWTGGYQVATVGGTRRLGSGRALRSQPGQATESRYVNSCYFDTPRSWRGVIHKVMC